MGFVWFLIGVISLAIILLFGFLSSQEAVKQNRSKGKWFVIGMFFWLNSFIALKLSRNAEEEGHSISLWSVLGVFFGVYALIAFESGLNAENKLHDFDSWVIIGFMFGLFALFVSCFVKPFEKVNKSTITSGVTTKIVQKTSNNGETWKCVKCATLNSNSKLFCTNCGTIKSNK